MPPRKRGPSSSSKKAARSSQSSQPSKFGIQHFFERHSQTTAGASSAFTNPPPDSHQVPKPLPPRPASEEVFMAQENPTASPISPEINKSVSVKRVRFSPGMIINQTQDDGGEEVTWKISPVNEKLRSLAGKLLLGKATAPGNASKPSGMLSACSERKNLSSSISVASLEKGLPSSKAMITEDVFTSMTKSSSNESALCQSCKSNDKAHSDGTSLDDQSPFKTPPSVPYRPGETLPVNGAVRSESSEQLDSHQHRKALLELLDQVKDAISTEEPSSNNTIFIDSRENLAAELHIDPSKEFLHVNSLKTSCHKQAQTFLLLEVSEKHETANSSISQQPFKILRLLDEECGQERILYLCDEWFYSITQPGDTVNVIGEFDNQGKCVVDRNNNFFVVHPDILISGTRVASSFNCPRRAVFDERLKCTEHSICGLTGTLLHQVFQAGLLNDSPSRESLEEYVRVVLEKNVENLYACGVNEDDMYSTFIEVIPKMLNWLNCYKSGQDPKRSIVKFGQHGNDNLVRITEVVDIEEMAWAPKFGLKGMIDASLRIKMQSDDGVLVEKVMPLEFKTGKATTGQSATEHYAQLILYTLLMSERYVNSDIDTGLLYYLHTDQTMGIKAQRSDLVGLIIRRNELATDLVKMLRTQALPPMLQNPSVCRGCRHLNICTIYHKARGGSTESSGLGEVSDSLVKHLSSAHYDFMLHWDHLIDMEAKTSSISKKGLFYSGSYRIGQRTNSLSSLVLDVSQQLNVNRCVEGGQFIYDFVRQVSCSSGSDCHTQNKDDATVSTSLDCSLRCGDYVILSTESGHTAVAKGVICGISSCRVSISLFRQLRLPGRIFSESVDVLREVWRIDKDEVASSYAIMRYNIAQLFFSNPQNNHLRKMIVDLEAPRFDSGGIFSQDPAMSYVRSEKNLNDDQRNAIQKMLTAKDYALILGMPGTGKTSTMVHAVKAFLMRGASILLSSYTNSAVDNLLLKLKAQGIDFIRVGRCEALHDDVRSHCFSATNKRSVEEIKQRMDCVRVVGVTCLGINHPLLANKKFDICILDEAGQITLPVSLGPLMLASKFILVGDHYQLPPLVQSTEAHESGMGLSLFCKLSEAHPHAISALQCQYRMSAGIMELPNSLVYGNRLRCGSSEIANAKLKVSCSNPLPLWLREILDPNLPVVFINTDSLPAIELREHRSVNNPAEAHIVSEITKELLNRDIAADEIGIITPYNSQAEIIRKRFASDIEIHTIDRYQGRDKDCIILSFVRSTEISSTCTSSLLGDWRRINVAITRAKKKLIMVGSVRTLSKVPLLKFLIKEVDQCGGILAIRKQDIDSFQDLKKSSLLST